MNDPTAGHDTTPSLPDEVAPLREGHQEDALDDALAATFPSSDPVAISIT
jgi:hypothetical protein